MPGGFPDQLRDVECTVHDFNSGNTIAAGRMDVQLIEHTDRLRARRARFRGEFWPDTPGDQTALENAMVMGFASGSAAHKIEVEAAGRTWVLVVKFVVEDVGFSFTGRNDPKPVL